MRTMNKQQGFTIIELVVVILLLGILTATALPRFIDVTDEAHAAAYDGVTGGFATGVAMYHAQWVGEDAGASAPSGWSITPTANGYPVSTTPATCESAFIDLLQGGRPEIIAHGSASADLATIAALSSADFTPGANDTWHVGYSTADNNCVFTYIGADTTLALNSYLTYDPADGEIVKGIHP